MPPRLAEQFLLGRLPRERNSRLNPASCRCYFLIRRPADPLLELRRAVAGEHQMGMRIDKSRRHQAASGVDHFRGRIDLRTQIRVSAGCAHLPVLDQQGGIADESQLAHLDADPWPRRPSQRDQLPDMHNGKVLRRIFTHRKQDSIFYSLFPGRAPADRSSSVGWLFPSLSASAYGYRAPAPSSVRSRIRRPRGAPRQGPDRC